MVVAVEPIYIVSMADSRVVLACPLSDARPEADKVPVMVVLPAAKVSAPISIAPKAEVIEPEDKAPVPVSDELTTAEPRVVAFKTEAPLMLKARPVAKLRLPET